MLARKSTPTRLPRMAPLTLLLLLLALLAFALARTALFRRAAFRVGYILIRSPLGLWLHRRQVARSALHGAHSLASPDGVQCGAFAVHVVPFLADNYAYLVVDRATRQCAVVDAGDAGAVLAAARRLGVEIRLALTTHGHYDHSGGNGELRSAIGPSLVVAGSGLDRIPALTLPVASGQEIE